MQRDIGMLLQEVFHEVGFVRRKVIKDDVNLTLGRLRVYNFLQESDKLLAGVSGSGLAEHLAGFWIQGCIQRERSVPVIFEPKLIK